MTTKQPKRKKATKRTIRRDARTGEFTRSKAKATTVEETVPEVLWHGEGVLSVGGALIVVADKGQPTILSTHGRPPLALPPGERMRLALVRIPATPPAKASRARKKGAK